MKFKQYLNEAIQRKSAFDSSVTVVIFNKDDPEYEVWEKKFKSYGIAVGVPKQKLIVWDGEQMKKLSKDQILFTEAHESAHFVLKKYNADPRTEVECDYWAITNLWKRGKKKAAKIGIDGFAKRHGQEFDVSDLKGYK